MRTGTNLSTTRDFNRLLILEKIRLHAPVTRIEIARQTGLTAPTVSNIVSDLLREGIILELGRRTPKRGQPPVELDINPDAAYTIGLHLDRDILTGVLADMKGKILVQITQDIELPSPELALKLLLKTYHSLLTETGIGKDDLLGIGVVTVGPLDIISGRVNNPPNFPGWDDIPLRQQLMDATGLPVFLDNNATAAAIGERWYGVGKGYQDFLYVYLGLGIGGGLFFNGHVHRGAGLNAGELGHMMVPPKRPGGEPVRLEECASLLALKRDLGPDYASAEKLSRKLTEKDARLLDWLEDAATCMAQVLAGIDNLLDLETMIFGGRLPEGVLTHFVTRVGERMAPYRMPGRPHYTSLTVGRVSDSAALGAASLPAYDAFVPISSLEALEV